MSRSACSVRPTPVEKFAPGLTMTQPATMKAQVWNSAYPPPPSWALTSALIPPGPPKNGCGGGDPDPVFSAARVGVPSKTRSARPSPLTSRRLLWRGRGVVPRPVGAGPGGGPGGRVAGGGGGRAYVPVRRVAPGAAERAGRVGVLDTARADHVGEPVTVEVQVVQLAGTVAGGDTAADAAHAGHAHRTGQRDLRGARDPGYRGRVRQVAGGRQVDRRCAEPGAAHRAGTRPRKGAGLPPPGRRYRGERQERRRLYPRIRCQ